MSVKILIADDHQLMREGFRALLEKDADFEVVGEAETGREAVLFVQRRKPDLVIMDIAMPDLNGIDAARQIAAAEPSVKLLAVSMHSDPRMVLNMLKAGASGFLLKACAFEELVRAIRSVSAGQVHLCPRVAGIVVQNFVRSFPGPGGEEAATCLLTPREREIVQLFAEGWSNERIGDHLCVSAKTISTHRRNILDKLGLESIAELTKYAIREGLTSL